MKITLTSVLVDGQAKALALNTEVLGVVFQTEPTEMGPVTGAVFEDTPGNLIQLHQV